MSDVKKLLKERLTAEHHGRLVALDNPKMHDFVADAIELTNPASVFVYTGSTDDIAHIRELAIKNGEEIPLNITGHTCHFDGYHDQARDKGRTKYLLSPGSQLGESLKSIEKSIGVEEVRAFLKDSMSGREMLVCFFCLGPTDSDFSIPCIQITDSPYVAHSEIILYRPGYEQFRKIGSSPDFFRFIHSEGELENAVSKNIDKRRVYAYLRKKGGQTRCVNVEKGIFGIIRDVNAEDDPVIHEALTRPGDIIFSNVLIDSNNKPHWLGMGSELPTEGIDHSGKWHKGKRDADGKEITASHRNARYCLNIPDLSNRDPLLDDPDGVPVGGIVYGGRDSDTWVPVEQAFNWTEGIIIKGAALESETTAATLGEEGVRTFNLMSNLDFLSIPLGRYIRNNLDFAKGVDDPPSIFSVNYFLKDEEGSYLNGMADKKVWILWAELRVNGDVDAIETPTGFIPKYEDLKRLFKEHLDAEYTQADYVRQFTLRVPENLAKLNRVEDIYKQMVSDTPQVLFETFDEVRRRLKAAGDKHSDYISPLDLII